MNKQISILALAIITLISYITLIPNAPNVQVIVYYPSKNLKGSMTLRGNNCGLTWNKGVLMASSGNNTWTVQITCPLNQLVQIKALQNDTNWMMGSNDAFKVLDTKTVTVSVYPSFHPAINKILDTNSVSSKILNNSRICSIYYPPSFYDNTFKKYPLLFMHDGQNLYDDAKSAFGAWKIQDTLNSLIPAGQMKQIIVIGIWNTVNRNNQYTYSYDPSEKFGGKGDLYLNFIEQQLLPLIKNLLVGRIQGQKYGIGGSSLGGLISCYGAYTRPNLFDKAICMSSSFWWNSEDFLNTIIKNQADIKIYLDSGDAGTSQDSKNQTVRVRNKFQSIGYKLNQNLYYYLDQGGQHSEYYWGKRFYIPLQYLYN